VLASDPLDDYQPPGAFGQPVYMSYVQCAPPSRKSWQGAGDLTDAVNPLVLWVAIGARGGAGSPSARGADALPPNPAQAVEWCRQVAEVGIAEAQYRLDILLKSGETDTPNGLELGVSWLRKAAEQGHPQAKDALPK
jgi:TPR repeat protein